MTKSGQNLRNIKCHGIIIFFSEMFGQSHNYSEVCKWNRINAKILPSLDFNSKANFQCISKHTTAFIDVILSLRNDTCVNDGVARIHLRSGHASITV